MKMLYVKLLATLVQLVVSILLLEN